MARIRELVIDAIRPAALARFWAAALDGYAVRPYAAAERARLAALGRTPETDPAVALDGPGPTLFFQETAARGSGRRRLHLDLVGAPRDAEVRRLCALGATLRDERVGHCVLLDPEGNEFCVQDPRHEGASAPVDARDGDGSMALRDATADDLPLLAAWNHELIQDQRSPNPMSVRELEERMRGWLAGEYRAVVFELGPEPVAYGLFRPAEDGVHLRQFFVARHVRRRGVGRRAVAAFRARHVPEGAALTLEVLSHNERGLAFWRALGFRAEKVSFRLAPAGPG